jgi:hypothetical protein
MHFSRISARPRLGMNSDTSGGGSGALYFSRGVAASSALRREVLPRAVVANSPLDRRTSGRLRRHRFQCCMNQNFSQMDDLVRLDAIDDPQFQIVVAGQSKPVLPSARCWHEFATAPL